ncbi:MAG: PadR family transcriptional regulator [Candidatus Aminicenantes bacterium]|nr:PadR family transcriptional regulator [Candidatus Aminicenantes bacterium]
MENKIKQLRKGVLELAIMGSLYHESHYGYSLIKSISGDDDIAITEGTIYPILNRLAKEKLVRSEWVESKQGPPRKYYSLTEQGKNTFEVLHIEFEKLAEMVRTSSKTPDKKLPPREGVKIEMRQERENDE